ncbi:site-specific integrase [uncultured Desulfovibrio sp.]|uniref:tyrosine-type recombinase/integrase n=1 Tax=uncultured Desulfovibrio sp. TaxID=167968 RepID=UPI00272B42D6|nr:site-specific integrase [uncultured Desulfovibrio sp.]
MTRLHRQHAATARQDDILELDAFVDAVYLPHVKMRKRSWRVDERITRKRLSPVFGDRRLDGILRGEVENWLHDLAAQGLSPSTCNRNLAVFKSVCSLAMLHGVLPAGQSPCAGVRAFKIHWQRERCLNIAEARRLMRALERSPCAAAAAIRLLLLTGARKSEILKARWENVRLDQRLLTVPLSKSGRPRHILLSDEAVAVLRALPRRPECPWLFPGHAPGKPLSDIFLFWRDLRSALGLNDIRIHDLRHTFASFLVNAVHSLYEVQKLLGHSDPRTTMRYAHLGQASLLSAAQNIGGFLSGEAREQDDAPRVARPAGSQRRARACAASCRRKTQGPKGGE